MHRTIRFALPLFAVLLSAACGLGPEKTVTFKADVATNGTQDCNTVGLTTVKLEDNADFNTYKDDLDNAKLSGVRVVVTNPNIDGTNLTTHATGKVIVTTSTGESLELGAYDVPVTEGAVQDVAFDQAAADKLVDAALKAPYTLEVSGVGTGDAYPCKFGFRVELDFTVQVSASAIF